MNKIDFLRNILSVQPENWPEIDEFVVEESDIQKYIPIPFEEESE